MNAAPGTHEGSAVIAEDLRTVVGRLVRRLRADYAIAPHQFSVLNTIERNGPQTASQLAALEIVRPQSMAHTLHQLAEAGFVAKRPDPTDGRQILIALSDAGRRAIEEQRRETTGWLSAAIDHELDGDELRALATAVALLGRLVEG